MLLFFWRVYMDVWLRPVYSAMSCLHVSFLIRKPSFYLSLNSLNFSQNWVWDVLEFFLSSTEINWLKCFTLSLLILLWIPSLTFWMQYRRNIADFLKILTIWASFSYELFSYRKKCMWNFHSAYQVMESRLHNSLLM